MSATEYDVMQEAQEIRRKRLEGLGLADQYDLWRESLPNARDMSDQEAYNAFMEAQGVESAALDGRVSVSTGGTDEGVGTVPATPGPDGDGPGTDAPGEVSEGAPEDAEADAERDTELKVVEGMWLPPEESEALNYIEPTTEQMAASPDWLENAKVLHKAMGSPIAEAYRDKQPTTPWMKPEDEEPPPPMTDQEIGEWARRELSMFNWNVASTVSYAHKIMSSDDPKLALAFLNLVNMYDHSDGGGVEFARALLGLATDPTTYVGLGVGTVAAHGVAKATAKAGLTKAIQMALIGGTAGAIEGGSLAGGFDLVVQNVEQEAGARQDIDYGRTGIATGVGIGAGTVLGGGAGGLIGRRMDKLAKMHDEIQRLVEGSKAVPEERAAEGLSETQLLEMLEASQRATAATEQRDEVAAIGAKYLAEGDIPRNADGTVDEIAMAEDFAEFHAKEKAREGGREPELGPKGQGEITVEDAPAELNRIVDDLTRDRDDPSGWFYDETIDDGELSYFEPDSDYAELEAMAERFGIEYDIGGRGGVEAFFVKGSNVDKVLFMQEVSHQAGREKILPGRRGGKPLTVEEGLARGLDDAEIAKLEMNPINVVEKLERAGFKVMLGEKGDIVFDAEGMSPATAQRIERIAAQTGVKATPVGALSPAPRPGPDMIVGIDVDPPTDPVERALYDAYRAGEGNTTDRNEAMQKWLDLESERSGGELVVEARDPETDAVTEVYRGTDLQAADKAWRVADREGTPVNTRHTTERGDFDPPEAFEPTAQGLINIEGDPVDIARFGAAMAEEVTPTKLPMAESRAFARRIREMEQTATKEVVAKTASLPGSHVRDSTGAEFEVMGRTKNGWYHLRNRLTGEEVNKRRGMFEVVESRPRPTAAGPMELKPFTTSAARIMAMNEEVVSGKLKKVKITTAEQRAIVDDLRKMGIDITEKKLAAHWTPAELMFLRDTYNAQAKGMHDLARVLGKDLENNGRLTDQQMALFNEAHTQFVATRDLFFGVSGNAARQLQILKSRPTDEVYEFSQAIMDSLSISGGRANTERAITMMAEFAAKGKRKPGETTTGAITKMSQNIWGNKVAAGFLITRYNMMLSSWRTHFFNFLGNSASGVYQHLGVIPGRMVINNMAYARNMALGVLDPRFMPDPADRMTAHSWYAGVRSHFSSARDSLMLAKEIALGRDIGEGKVWNELGLRYNVINVPDSAFAKLGTTPVRLLEAGDAFFKNQYYMAKIHELASIKARTDTIHRKMDFQTQYQTYVDGPDAAMQRTAKDYAAKQTYTNDPNVYGGILSALARGAAAAQNRHWMVNMIIPFVRTPANLLSYSMEMIGANVVLSPSMTYNAIMKGTAAESQEALAKLGIAAGMWMVVGEMYQNGDITGTGPSNWEERKVWEAAGWQANSIRVQGKYYDIARADPAGQSLVSIASVFDYYAMTQQQQKPALEWIGAGLLYTADMMVDESYLSTASDMITAISSKEEARVRSVTASLVNSVVVPNLLRDLRRPADEARRSAASENTLDQIVKQMKNASPWHSEDLPPQRDWKGDPVNYYSNAYARGFIPFEVRDPSKADPASMALAYARIPVSTPNRTIDWPKGQGDGIDLFAMDEGDGFVYDKYKEIIGKARLRTVNELMAKPIWRQMVKEGNIGPGSDGDNALRRVLAIGSRNGRLQMLDFLIKHSGDNNSFRRGNGDLILIHHPVSVPEYKRLKRLVRRENVPVPEELRQYQIQERQEGPEFFTPRTPE